ncbi:unnamed protein product [Thlaspi arvense]|uniref:Uncharacterized protein n=1 Tax=Thlaspi arvense TaxID=13288 RepID=A0AAU9RSN7_THLAR|nr:unnamed protein product [Thlaspi arvense]
MKQKVVIRLSSGDSKNRTKALKVAVGAPGFESVVLEGESKTQMAVTGGGLDPVNLMVRLKKKLGLAELISVTPIKAEEGNTEEGITMQTMVWQPYHSGVPQYYVY